MFDKVDELKTRLDKYRPLSAGTLASLRESLLIEWTYNSNAIEGNTLTLKETKVVLEGITVGGKTMREHLEAINHKEAIEVVESLVSGTVSLSESVIKNIHQIVLKGIDLQNAGQYRKENVLISGANHIPPDFLLIPDQMQLVLAQYKEFTGHPIERAARLHTDFVKVHPFVDGNGRTARLLLNLELMSTGYSPVIIKAENRLAYYDTLDIAHTKGDYSGFIALVADLEIEALSKILRLVEK